MPVYNMAEYISFAIDSVLDQDYNNWELIIINDGSTDGLIEILSKYNDPRIIVLSQENSGVSVARNLGLSIFKGEYLCFLDADDVYVKHSLSARILHFQNNPDLNFVDGRCSFYDKTMTVKIREFLPTYTGEASSELIELGSSCFVGLTWMIKRDNTIKYEFLHGITHGEDFLFLLSIGRNKKYGFINSEIQRIRVGNISAMSNLRGLERGYRNIFKVIKRDYSKGLFHLIRLKIYITKVMFLSYLKNGQIKDAIFVLFKYSFI